MRSPVSSLLAFGALVAVGVGGYELWTVATAPSAPSPAPTGGADDDLAMLASLADAGAASAHWLLAAAAGRQYATHGSEGAIDVRSAPGGPSAPLAPVGAPIAGLAVAGDTLWITTGHSVLRVPGDGGAPVIVAERLAQPRAIAADGKTVVVVDFDTSTGGLLGASRVVRIVEASGPTLRSVVLGRYPGPIANVALDQGTAYWADRLEGNLLAAAAEDAEPRVLASSRGIPGQVLIVGDSLVWVEQRGEALWIMPKIGGAPRLLVQDLAGFAHVVAHGARVAWVNEAAVSGKFRVLEVPIDGGDPVALGAPGDAIDALASDGTRLFWMRDGVIAELGRTD